MSSEQIASRLISGTRISKILGLSKYGNARDAWEEIVNGYSDPPNQYTARGNVMEPIIREIYISRTGAERRPVDKVVSHREYEWATCSPDELVTVDGRYKLVDYKSANIWTKRSYGSDGSDAVPLHYLVQVAWNSFVCDTEAGELFVAFGEDGKTDAGDPTFQIKFTRRFLIGRDAELEAMMLEAGERFWVQHIMTGIPPDMEPMPRKKRRKAA